MSTKLKSKRIIYYDFIRAFAIFGVVACHCFSYLVINTDIFNTRLWFYSMFLNCLRDISVPLFVCVSGALLITKKDTIITFLKKRVNKVIVPFIFWVIAFIIIEIIMKQPKYPMNIVVNTLSIPPVGSGIIFWFVQMILVVYLVIIILNKLISKNENFLKLALLLSIIYIVLLNLGIIPEYQKPYNYLFYSVFAVFGYYASRYDFANNKLSKSLGLTKDKLAVLFFVLSVGLYILEIYINISMSIGSNKFNHVSQFSILNIVTLLSFFLFFRYFTESEGKISRLCNYIKNSNVGKAIFSISFCSYGIYLSHKLIVDYFLLSPFVDYPSPSVFATLMLIVALIGSWLVILVMSKVPGLKKVSGV